MKSIEGIEKFFLGRDFFATERLDIIDQQEVKTTVSLFELFHFSKSQVFKKVIDKAFGRNVLDTRIRNIFQNLISNRIE